MMKTSFRVMAYRSAQWSARNSASVLTSAFPSPMSTKSSDNMPPYDGHLVPEQMDTLIHMYDHIDILDSKVDEFRKTSDKPKYEGHLTPEQMETLDHMLDKITNIEAHVAGIKQAIAEAQKTYAVDSPDGDSDGHVQEELAEVQHIIDDAAANEDKESVLRKHKLEDDVKKFHARDPEHDW